MKVKEHYENHLASHYTWIYGGSENKIKENREFFKSNGIKPVITKTALDLGAGSGFQSIPLAELGYEVTAVDISQKLLDELKNNKKDLDIKIINDDILNFNKYPNPKPDLIVCMGDTLTHLKSINQVKDLLTNSFRILKKNGKLILTFRDLTYELENDKRFIPIRSSENKIFTCFLEYEKEKVKIFDIVHEKENGKWKQKISFYEKLKISISDISRLMEKTGFKTEKLDIANGMITVIGIK